MCQRRLAHAGQVFDQEMPTRKKTRERQLDLVFLAQKNGAVASHVRVAKTPEELHSTRIPEGGADLALGCDIVVATGLDGMQKLSASRSQAIINTPKWKAHWQKKWFLHLCAAFASVYIVVRGWTLRELCQLAAQAQDKC